LYKALSKPLKVKTLGAGEAESLKKMMKAFKRQRRLNGKKETKPITNQTRRIENAATLMTPIVLQRPSNVENFSFDSVIFLAEFIFVGKKTQTNIEPNSRSVI
jgi:hypothetical protein